VLSIAVSWPALAQGSGPSANLLLNIQNMPEARTTAVSGTRDWTRVSTVFHSAGATELEINCLFRILQCHRGNLLSFTKGVVNLPPHSLTIIKVNL
jgi:hypothetical protein